MIYLSRFKNTIWRPFIIRIERKYLYLEAEWITKYNSGRAWNVWARNVISSWIFIWTEGVIIGDSKILETGDPCSVDHSVSLESVIQAAAYNSILWKDDPEEFDRKYGNEKRIDIASKLFPPPPEE